MLVDEWPMSRTSVKTKWLLTQILSCVPVSSVGCVTSYKQLRAIDPLVIARLHIDFFSSSIPVQIYFFFSSSPLSQRPDYLDFWNPWPGHRESLVVGYVRRILFVNSGLPSSMGPRVQQNTLHSYRMEGKFGWKRGEGLERNGHHGHMCIRSIDVVKLCGHPPPPTS